MAAGAVLPCRRGGGAAGSVVHRPVGLVDLAPTFCTIAGIEPPEWMQGAPLPVDDADAEARGFDKVLTEWDSELFGVDVHLRTMFRDRWVVTTYRPGTSHDGTEGELYDLVEDPLQRVNRWDDPAVRPLRDDLVADLWDSQPAGPGRPAGARGAGVSTEPGRRLLVGSVAGRGRRPPPARRAGRRQPGTGDRRGHAGRRGVPHRPARHHGGDAGPGRGVPAAQRHGSRRHLLGGADRPRHPGDGGRLGAVGRRPDVARRARRPRQRLALRGVRHGTPTASPRTSRCWPRPSSPATGPTTAS